MSQTDFTTESRRALLSFESPVTLQSVLTAMLLVALFVANLSGLRAFVVTVVAIAALWAWDLTDTAAKASVPLNPYPIVLAPAGAALGAYRWGFEGFAIATVAALAVVLVWAVVLKTHREIASLASTGLAVMVGSAGAGSLVLLRMRWDIEVNAFIAVTAGALVVGILARWFQQQYPLFDPNIGALVAGAIIGLVSGSVSSLDLSPVFVASVAAAGGLVAGNTAGSLLRTGHISLTDDPPGPLGLMDGPLMAAGIFWLAMITLST